MAAPRREPESPTRRSPARTAPLPPFEQVVTRHGPTVLRVCRAMLGVVDADDAWSETFLSALRAYPDLTPGTNLEAWLVTVAHRKAIDVHRARGRNPVPTDTLPERAATTGLPGDGDGELWSRVASLPFTQRAALVYHYIGGLPYTEIAEILGNSAAAARRAAADGRAALRRQYSVDTGSTP